MLQDRIEPSCVAVGPVGTTRQAYLHCASQQIRTPMIAPDQTCRSSHPMAEDPGLASVSLINRRKEQACLPRLLLRALSRLIEQPRRALCRGHLGARSRASGLAPPTAGGQLTILDYRAPAGFGPPRHLH